MRASSALLLVLAVASIFLNGSWTTASASPYSQQANSILQGMSPEERVGQLFLVTFRGATPDAEHPIFELISRYHISGVVLRAENDNFVASPDTLAATVELVTALQNAGHAATLVPTPFPGDLESEDAPTLYPAVDRDQPRGEWRACIPDSKWSHYVAVAHGDRCHLGSDDGGPGR